MNIGKITPQEAANILAVPLPFLGALTDCGALTPDADGLFDRADVFAHKAFRDALRAEIEGEKLALLRQAWTQGVDSGDSGEIDFDALKKEARKRQSLVSYLKSFPGLELKEHQRMTGGKDTPSIEQLVSLAKEIDDMLAAMITPRRSILAAEIDDEMMARISAAKIETDKPYTLDDIKQDGENSRRAYAIEDMPEDHRRMIEAAAAIADELEDLRALIRFIATDRHELSAEKAIWQRDEWKRRAVALVEKHRKASDTPAAPRQFDDDF